jgi:predicted heme/steroid binding protein
MNEIYYTIRLLYYSADIETKNTLLKRLEEQLGRLSQLFNMTLRESIGGAAAIPVQGGPAVFTISELSKYNGVNGNPAYVAVNGIVYDVTNNAAWAAATHFGLKAGTDLTAAFASCHANQDILSRLKPVGRLRNESLL